MWDGRYPGEQFTSEAYKANVAANGYAIAKVLCERAVTTAAEASDGLWDALITNPGDNYGPLLAPHQLQGGGGGFPRNVARIIQGKQIAMLSAYHPMWTVDVRDTAAGHVNLLRSATARNGARHLMISREKATMEDLCGAVCEAFADSPLDPTPAPFDNEPEEVRAREG
jgi:nucleoside-diphosphate-sugar epimerase